MALALLLPALPAAAPAGAGEPYPGWRLGVQTWTFRCFTLFEAFDRIAGLGLKTVEAYPGQPISADHPEARFGPDLERPLRRLIRERLRAAGLRIVNFGVLGLSGGEKECRRYFDFAREMGIETLVCEPPEKALDMLEGLCREYGIGLAIHNHPKPTRYWDPRKVASLLRGRSPLLGACVDTGHWLRSGLDPLACLRLLEGRIRSLHIKDRSARGKESAKVHDVPLGTGVLGLPAVLTEMRRQGFQGVFSIEFEYNWRSSLPQVAACVKGFGKAAKALPVPAFEELFTSDLSGAFHQPGSWSYAKGLLTRLGGGDIWTRKRYGNFVLECQFRTAKGSNSGIFLRTGDLANWLHTAIEVQILDSHGRRRPGRHDCGAIFDILAPEQNLVRPAGEWNRYRITAIGPIIQVELNGRRVIHLDLDLWTTAHRNPDGSRNKFNLAYRDMARSGHIGFQDHGGPVTFRNIRIKSFD